MKKDEKHIASNAVGWSGKESESDDKERRRVLRKIYDMYGFRVTVEDPARKVIYKVVDDFESFSFHYDELSDMPELMAVHPVYSMALKKCRTLK